MNEYLIIVVAVVVLAVAAYFGLKHLQRRNQDSNLSTTAGFADDRDFTDKKRSTDSYLIADGEIPQAGVLPLGRIKDPVSGKPGKRVISRAQTSGIVVGPTGSAKTSRLIIPAILMHRGPLLTTSVKSELAEQTRLARSAQGVVSIFDPAETLDKSDGRVFEHVCVWTPLVGVSDMITAREIAALLIDSDGKNKNGETFWDSSAKGMLACLMWLAKQYPNTSMEEVQLLLNALSASDPVIESSKDEPVGLMEEMEEEAAAAKKSEPLDVKSLNSVMRYILTADNGWLGLKDVLDEVLAVAEDEAHLPRPRFDRKSAKTIIGEFGGWVATAKAEETAAGMNGALHSALGSIRAAINIYEAKWDDPALLDLNGWAASRGDTIYLIAPDAAQPYRGMFSAFLGIAVRALDAAARSSAKRTLEHQALVALDELANICPVPQLQDWLSTKRSQNVRFILGIQNYSQLFARWGKEVGMSIIDSCPGFQMLFAGSTDHETTKYFADYGGTYEHILEEESKTVGTSKSWGEGSDQHSKSESTTKNKQRTLRPLVEEYALREMTPGHAFALIFGRRAVQLEGIAWYKDDFLKQLQEGNPGALAALHAADDVERASLTSLYTKMLSTPRIKKLPAATAKRKESDEEFDFGSENTLFTT